MPLISSEISIEVLPSSSTLLAMLMLVEFLGKEVCTGDSASLCLLAGENQKYCIAQVQIFDLELKPLG